MHRIKQNNFPYIVIIRFLSYNFDVTRKNFNLLNLSYDTYCFEIWILLLNILTHLIILTYHEQWYVL